MSFIRLQAAGVAERVNVLLTGMAYRIDAVGQLHEILSTEPQEAAIDLGEHLQKMCSAMQPLVSLMGPTELC